MVGQVLSRWRARVQNIQCHDEQGKLMRGIFISTSRMSRWEKCLGKRSKCPTEMRVIKISIGSVADEYR